jgi:hypothetical protein
MGLGGDGGFRHERDADEDEDDADPAGEVDLLAENEVGEDGADDVRGCGAGDDVAEIGPTEEGQLDESINAGEESAGQEEGVAGEVEEVAAETDLEEAGNTLHGKGQEEVAEAVGEDGNGKKKDGFASAPVDGRWG